MDQVTAKITIADSNPAEGWRYRLKVFMPDGREVIVHTATSGSAVLPLPRFVPALQPWPKHLHQPVFVEGPGYLQRHDAAVKREGNALTLEHVIEVNDELFDRALLEFDYFPDAGNPNEKVRLDIRCGDDE
jgi:hypothetical protein